MYKRLSLLKEPNNSLQKLWRYLRYERLLDLLNKGALYFSHITKMPDAWEGLLTERTKDKFFEAEYLKYNNVDAARSAVEQYESHKDSFYVNCWHMNDHESYLMWKVYGNRECAIQTNYERLQASFWNGHPEIDGGIVNYIDYEREVIPIGNIFYPVSYKDLAYKDEKEFRLLYWKLNEINQNYSVGEKGVSVKIDIDMLVENIYINPTSKQINIKNLIESLENKGINREKVRSSRIKEKF